MRNFLVAAFLIAGAVIALRPIHTAADSEHWAPGVAPTVVIPDYMEGQLEFTPLPLPQELEFGPSCLVVGRVVVVAPADYPHPFTLVELADTLGVDIGPARRRIANSAKPKFEVVPDDERAAGFLRRVVPEPDTVVTIGAPALAVLAGAGLEVPSDRGPEAYALFVGKDPAGAEFQPRGFHNPWPGV